MTRSPVVGIDLLDIHAIDFRVFVMDKATADSGEFLGTVPDPLGKVGKRLLLDAVRPVIEHREGPLGIGRQPGKEQAGQQ